MVPDGAGRRATLADVASQAGVSKSIASRVLNDDGRVSVRPETRRRIVDAAARLGYRAHAAARLLRHARTGVLGLLTPDLANTVITGIVRAAVVRARALDYALVLYEDADGQDAAGQDAAGQDAAETALELSGSGRVDGLIVASARPGHPLLPHLARSALPHVFVNRGVEGSGRSVTMDDAAASALAVDHLVGLGHRRLGHVAGPRALDPVGRRADGFAARARHHGLREEDAVVVEGDLSAAGGAAAAGALLDRDPRPTAIYVSSLTQAPAVVREAHRRGLRIPDDLSVCTYDESELAAQLIPALTTIAMPVVALATAAVDALAAQLGGAEPADLRIPDAPALVHRESTGVRPAAGAPSAAGRRPA